MSILDHFYDELEKIADSLDYERYESEGGRREGNPWTPIDNSQSESHETKLKDVKKVLKDRMKKKKKKLKKEPEDVKILTNNGTEYEEDDPEKESYNEKIAQVVRKGNTKIHQQDIL